MLSPKNRKGIMYKYLGKKKTKTLFYIHLCKNCDREIYKSSHQEKTATGFCQKCSALLRIRIVPDRIMTGLKECNLCKRFLDIKFFDKSFIGYKTTCKKCLTVKKYGITSIHYENLLIYQKNKCAICKIDNFKLTKNLAVDHCHKTNKIRGLLCMSCNTGLGKFKDSKQLLISALNYLK